MVQSSPAVAGGVVYVGSSDKNVYALNTLTGALVWNYTTGNVVASSPAVAGGIVYVGSDDNKTYALDASTGTLVWNYTTGNYVESSPAVVNGIVYIGSDDDYVYALDAPTGALVWKYKTGSTVWSSPAVAGGIVYIGSLDDYVYALDAPTGALVWKYKTSYWITLSFAIADGVLYVPNESGDLYAFGDKTPPKTYLTIGNPKYVDSTGNLYVASFTLFALTAMDNVGGSGVQSTAYRIYNASYNTGWLLYTAPFSLAGLRDGSYSVDYNSTDKAGNVETTSTQNVILNSKATMIGYAKNEIQALINQVHGSMIFQWFKDYLEINVLKYALKQDGMAFDFAVKGDVTSANSALKGCKGTMAGFISSVMNLKAFGLIPAATANIWIATAQTIINDLNTAIATP
jgi:hypothetical protein